MALLCAYTYDPLDRVSSLTPLAQAVSRRFYNGERLMAELQGETQRTFVRAGGHLLAQQNRDNDRVAATLIAGDRHNSVLHASNAGQQTDIAYSPYGHHDAAQPIAGLPGFNGEQPDPITGHYLLGNGYRAFNPVLMRFNSPDSLSPFGKGGLNAYAYCAGDPVSRIDPTGHFLVMPLGVGSVSGAARARVMAAGIKALGNTLGKMRTAVGKRSPMRSSGRTAEKKDPSLRPVTPRNSIVNRQQNEGSVPGAVGAETSSQTQGPWGAPKDFLDIVKGSDYVYVNGQWFKRIDKLPGQNKKFFDSTFGIGKRIIDVRTNDKGDLQIVSLFDSVVDGASYNAVVNLQ
ncbi:MULTISPECIES: RHS repeat-associated core domain-containing protein [Pseudomonas syringae group]|uniref:RHS repeat-associated core domain-containing protein n=4 Tax=Pseudomonas syringae group TaxID=136849 RepID=A0AAW4DWS0_PSESX|nr:MULTISPECIES: RHS repeat-associated core domain-containing protein [Pseudomonas syringae group]AVI87071.1 RHS repeat-associated core domain-containing protein [Pseudomonas syringae pv. tomato]EEB59309.1 hypothetical protein PSPTOT1_2656 [Pseudomonas syringae pv. tomato T1]KGK94328.1 hypothetical protein NB04_16355 [Pseudomonas syringae pv. tomato]KUR39440.1 hypothetical protein PSTA9_04935 [Pseudomonas syringae pv. tomato]MBI6697478.1 RHS repeat-associated core domain-containing protein [Ps